MDPQATASTTISPSNSPQVGNSGLLNKFKKSSKRTKILIGAGLLGLILAFAFYFMSGKVKSQETIATVGNTSIPRSYLDIELDYYPATRSAEINQFLTKKIIDDQVTLLAGKQAGIISSFPDGSNITNKQYLERTALVSKVKEEINKKAPGIEAEVVSIWFYNGIFAPIGYKEGKQKALTKITQIYNRVKSNEITMEQAGKEISSDMSLAGLDKSYKENAYTVIKATPDRALTFWKEFDDMLWKLEPGQLTPVYTAKETDSNNKAFPALFIFGKLSQKMTDATALNYDDWLAEQKKVYEVK